MSTPTGMFLINNASLLGVKLLEHLYLSLSATLLAIIIGIPLGTVILNRPALKNTVLSVTSIFQTIPSLALLVFLIPFIGIGFKPTIVTLTLYALLPIIRNTFMGLTGVPPESVEAARAMGFTRWQRLRLVELPLALPIIVAGIRTATAMTIGITTIAAFIGAGGLGDFITQGLSLNDPRLILLGAIPTSLLAIALDFIMAYIESALSHRQRQLMKYKKIKLTFIFILLFASLYLMIDTIIPTAFKSKKNTIVIATKNFSEQYILGDIMADMIETRTHLTVRKKFNLGSTAIIQNALLNGEIDLYPEYTGTAYLTVLHHANLVSAPQIFKIVKKEYQQQFNLIWLNPFGFNNSQTLAVRADFAKQHRLKTLSDLAVISPRLTISAPAEFLKRPDALPGLKRVYGFRFKRVIQMQPDLIYQAIRNKDVNVIEVFTTDGRIPAYHLVPLEDDKHLYPPYYAAPVIREAFLKAHPEVEKALAPLAGLIDEKTMQHLNALVDIKHESPKKVVHDFLVEKGLIKLSPQAGEK
ncbi:glycine betaine ABC transporter substrate-binding protein [Coxiella burnetii]|uniref:glycine betaine ABC transporter substrate-binding protein n=1 Tax=Coxiella burnetii TaxID=777 RepID=UPI00051F17F5|nr:glycine betaine ABC transporter substrate-binding protein [Coxiella burnetii]AIT62684.1 Glycine betaine transport system permease protein [Coxiella burnetii str. Namibia]